MARSVRVHRFDPAEPVGAPDRPRAGGGGADLARRMGAAGALDLGSRIALAAQVQASAGNAAMAHLAGLVRTDHAEPPPEGVGAIGSVSNSPGTRGYTRTSYVSNPPIYLPDTAHPATPGGPWSARPQQVAEPSVDFDVYWPSPGRHRIGRYSGGTIWLRVTDEWSARLLAGENEHVSDNELAFGSTWGRVARTINDLAAEPASTGATMADAEAAAWRTFKARLPAGLRPDGGTPSPAAQLAVWGAHDTGTVFRQLMNESGRVRDGLLWHVPDEGQVERHGGDVIYELSPGHSRIGETSSADLVQAAWARITGG